MILCCFFKIVEDDLRSLMYCHFTPNNEDNQYMEVEDVDKFREVVEGFLDEYNNMSKKPMNLVIFRSDSLLFNSPPVDLWLSMFMKQCSNFLIFS